MEINNQLITILQEIKRQKPLVHHITNYVTVNDCANIVLALGGSPVMADDQDEVEEMVSIASALVLNIGTLNKRSMESFLIAGKKANEIGVPVILDPVGVGATNLRNEIVRRILKNVKLSVLRGNMSEIKNIYGIAASTKGVDSIDNPLDGGKEIALELAKRLQCTVVITGAVDIISDGGTVYYINNGHEMLTNITGTGCMSSSLIGLCCGTGKGSLHGAIAGMMIMGIAGEKAQSRLKEYEGLGSFKVYLMDAISKFSIEDIQERGKVNEIK
ncbi:hydroxyethylthiazole kinase [Clostridium formicaceticum]|uniref:Hydroxyethylthiazole kinase n=1 Tax=Clostridium formicaceticum TaxID=1497 RepID=A0AAC9WH22_9CLOT|nr:hydroxyethylthiazole kinase [Clostridium formicaceticum]AOY77854.1 hydroxyethylthiazole kinase [Clostridium formicaceticum]ARE88471.1 Hydroxyethylthiazole kinase [Clostridium formicaceticum]